VAKQKGGTLFFVGHARLPDNIASGHEGAVLSLELEVEPDTDVVVNVSCTGIPLLGEKLIIDVLIDYDLKQTLDSPKDEIRRRYFGPAQKPMIASLEKAYERYLQYKRGVL